MWEGTRRHEQSVRAAWIIDVARTARTPSLNVVDDEGGTSAQNRPHRIIWDDSIPEQHHPSRRAFGQSIW
ncbi:MAG: hypothetical protein SOH95_03695 [Bifidobacterium crudilactis]